MKWTDETPTECGFYFFQRAKGTFVNLVRIIDRYDVKKGIKEYIGRLVTFHGDSASYLLKDDNHFNNGRWAGPIPEPTEE